MEQARRPALAHHVHRTAPMGPRVLINGIWYKASKFDPATFRDRYEEALLAHLEASRPAPFKSTARPLLRRSG
jgi:hypothetical protein